MILRRHTIALLLLVVLVLASMPAPAAAHGGGVPRLVNASAGPYRVSAWTQPDPVRTGDLHVTIAVSDPVSGAPVLNTAVEAAVTRSGFAGEPAFTPAPRGFSPNKLFHEIDLEIAAKGSYQVTVRVKGPGGSGQNRFELDVLPAAPGVSGSLTAAAVAAAALITALLFYARNQTSVLSHEIPTTPSKEAIL